MSKKAKASELTFISRIKPDGSGVVAIGEKENSELQARKHMGDTFTLSCLSITNGTYIASGFHSYVVKYKLST